MKKKGGVGFKAVSLNDSFEEEEDVEEEASPFPPPPGTKRNEVNEKEEEETFATPMTTFKIKTGSDDATAANDVNGLTSEERGGVSAKTNVASGGNGGNGGFGSNDSSPTTLIANESRDTISELRNNINASSPTKKNNTNFLYNNNHQQQYNHHQNRNEKDNNESDVYHVHNRSISATSMDGLISRLDEESGNGGVGERTNDSRFNEFSDGGGRRREDGSNSSSNAIVRACSKALDIPWCFGESRKTRKNVVSISIVLLLILFAAIPLRHWQHMS